MNEEEYLHKINKFISDIEKVRDGHNAEALNFNLDLPWHHGLKRMHEEKAKAYDFVIRKLKRTFNI